MTIQINGTSGISGVDGSAATPALQGTDSNTGITFGTDIVNVVTGGTTRATVDSSGNLGVGTTPEAWSGFTALEVSEASIVSSGGGDAFFSANAYYDGAWKYKDAGVARNIYMNSDGIVFRQAASGSADGAITWSENVRIDSSGNLGIGVTSPAGAVHVGKPSGNTKIFLQRTNAAANTNDYGSIVWRSTNDNNNGVIGVARESAENDGYMYFSTATSGTVVERMRISSAGRLFVPGVWDYSTSGGTTVVVTSDDQIRKAASSLKYKTDIETLEDSYADRVLDVRPVYYRSTCEGDNPNHSYWGFIAEEVAEIDPRLVTWNFHDVSYDEDGGRVVTERETPEPEGVAYDRFVPHLLNLIKRQKEAIEALETRVAQLEGGAS